jgi:hypothetical protein
MQALTRYCDFYSSSMSSSKKKEFSHLLLEDFSSVWSADRIRGMFFIKYLERPFIPPIFRNKLEVGLAAIVHTALNSLAHLRFRLNRHNRRVSFLERSYDDWIAEQSLDPIQKDRYDYEWGLANENIVETMLDSYIEHVHSIYPLIFVTNPHKHPFDRFFKAP